MNELPSHGTGYAESEAFMDVVVLLSEFMGDESTPDFTVAQRRLRDSFNLSELYNLQVIAKTLGDLIDTELAERRGSAVNTQR